jgi:hypothetical protein
MSYNILADYLAQDHHDLYEGIPPGYMAWNWRKNQIGREIGWWQPDILCFQVGVIIKKSYCTIPISAGCSARSIVLYDFRKLIS